MRRQEGHVAFWCYCTYLVCYLVLRKPLSLFLPHVFLELSRFQNCAHSWFAFFHTTVLHAHTQSYRTNCGNVAINDMRARESWRTALSLSVLASTVASCSYMVWRFVLGLDCRRPDWCPYREPHYKQSRWTIITTSNMANFGHVSSAGHVFHFNFMDHLKRY